MPRIRIEFPEPAVFTYELPVRISDINYGNHLGHDSLISLLHEARARMLSSHGMTEVDIDGLTMVMTDLAVRYLSEALFSQVLRIEIAVAELRASSCELCYRVSNLSSGRTVALATTGLAFIDRTTRRVAPIPSRLAGVLGKASAPG
jgi:acyl-CoA thioesterase FadM